jgi:NADH:ubiquinone oxidoreductase subunit E/ActR/RegA family two-component response regulator
MYAAPPDRFFRKRRYKMVSTHPQPSQSARVDVVVIDDEDSIREGCRQTLESGGYHALVATDGMEGIELVKHARPRVVLLDLRLPGISGVEVLEKLPGIDPSIIPIIITGYGTVDSAVQTMKLGAFDFLSKPFDMDQLLGVVDRGLHRYEALVSEAPVAKPPPGETPKPSEPDILLKGLEALGQYYSLGLRDHTMGDELRALEAEAQYHSKVLGQIREKEKAIAELLADLRLVDEVVERHGFRKNALIQILLDIQSQKNWLPRHTLLWVSRRLNVSLAQVYQIAEFYEAFSLTPQGRHTVQVCMGTACHVQRAPEFLATVSALLGIKPGQTDSKLLFTLKTAHCFGCCALAPVMKIDETYHRNQPLKKLKAIFSSYAHEQPSDNESKQVGSWQN